MLDSRKNSQKIFSMPDFIECFIIFGNLDAMRKAKISEIFPVCRGCTKCSIPLHPCQGDIDSGVGDPVIPVTVYTFTL